MSEENEGHSAYSVWLIYTFRAVEKVLPALKAKTKYGWVAPAILCLLVLLALLGMGIYIDGYGIHPPAQYTGLCPAPAQIVNNGQRCQLITTITVTESGGAVTTVHQTIQAGTVLYNQTRGA